MVRCPNGTRKNKKTGECEPVLSNKPAVSRKVRPTKKELVHLDESDIDFFLEENADDFKRKNIDPEIGRAALRKVYYKPRFESEFYYPKAEKASLRRRKIPKEEYPKYLLHHQVDALFAEWRKSYISLDDFYDKGSFYSHTRE